MKFLLLIAAATVLSGEPARIVSTAPGITEMLFAAGLGAHVVGVSTYCHYPPEVSKIAKVGTYTQPNLEVILSLKPSLVVIQKNPIQLKEKLESLHLKVLELNYDNIAGIYRSIEQLEPYGGRSRELTGKIRAGLESVRNRAMGLPKRRVVFVVGRNPGSLEGTVVAGRGSYLSEAISIAGGVNIFDDTVSPYPKVGLEELLARRPDVIIDMGDMSQTAGVTEAQKRGVESLWKQNPLFRAMGTARIYAVASDIYVVPGPRVVEAARAFARMLHPGAGF
jgi:iron complex transport system substrate-binding protein